MFSIGQVAQAFKTAERRREFEGDESFMIGRFPEKIFSPPFL